MVFSFKRYFILFIVIFILFLGMIFFLISKEKPVNLAEEWFLNMQKEEGAFYYNYYPLNNTFENNDNIVRQVGSFYSLIKIYNITKNSNTLKSIYLFKNYAESLISYKKIRGVEIAYLEYDYTAKVNTNALYVLALIEMQKSDLKLSEKDYLDMEKLVEGMKYMVDDEGGFWYVFFLEKSKNRIDYYGSGEAMFALVSYYKYVDSDVELLNFVNENFEKFFVELDFYEFDQKYKSFFLWGLLYLNEVYEINSELKWRLYLENMVSKAMEFRINNEICFDNGCIIDYTSGEYAYFEGIANVFMKINDEKYFLDEKVFKYINESYDEISSWQIKSVQDYEDKSLNIFNGDEEFLIGGFCDSFNCSNIRVDYTQHAICGLLYLEDYYY